MILVLAGTVDGRELAANLMSAGHEVCVSVVSDYGKSLAEQSGAKVQAAAMTDKELEQFIRDEDVRLVIDATHPYATVVTATVKQACAEEQTEYLRLVRPVGDTTDAICVHDFAEAVELLNHLDGNIFLTTGSKNLPDFTGVENYAERIALRVLPMENSLHTALSLGYKPASIVCMQGPFSKELNVAMLKKYGSKFMVTKDSGAVGGFDEKVEAAAAAGAKLIVIGRAQEETGAGYSEIVDYLKQHFAAGN